MNNWVDLVGVAMSVASAPVACYGIALACLWERAWMFGIAAIGIAGVLGGQAVVIIF